MASKKTQKLLSSSPVFGGGSVAYSIYANHVSMQEVIDEQAKIFIKQQEILEQDGKIVIDEMSKLDCAATSYGHYPAQYIFDSIEKGERFIGLSMSTMGTVFCCRCGCIVGVPIAKLKSQNMSWVMKPQENIPF